VTKLNEMKHLLTLVALLVSTLSLAQFTPYNPDADNDQFVGAQDLLAFLPLFGEDWNLDSLVVYGISELQPPFFCPFPANTNNCEAYGYRQIPSDADIIFADDDMFNGQCNLILPDQPKPLLIFGARGDTELSRETYFANESGYSSWNDVARVGSVEKLYDEFIMLMGLDGKWWMMR
jgi:hypothetical protein